MFNLKKNEKMKNNIMKTLILFVAIITFFACNKTKLYTNRLDGGEWSVTSLTVDGTNQDELPHWNINECDAYDETCIAEWKDHHSNIAKFAWQFRDKGKAFEISNQTSFEEATEGLSGHDFFAAEENLDQCQSFSGVYEVVTHKKKEMEFKSNSTVGYPEQTVIIKIVKQ